ncbi:hypothetical protein CBR_g30947 [Chara braunii]|uniref:Uncharacterized protein n=1 Tax=Chara braunii TaxID=69332 RepID=A0A388LDV7_CHABU|nr:hypothetical protein CBR_g30947 [Chara braunii]|eukprot:GBG80485.1 hypothetical protein CBR_g30947 [Chara braunii]
MMELRREQKGGVVRARELLKQAVTADPSHAPAWQAWGRLEQQQGNIRKARQLFAKATSADPSHAPSWQAWALLESSYGDVAESQRLFSKATTVCSDHVQSWVAWALFEWRVGNFERARELFSKGAGVRKRPSSSLLQAWGTMEEKLSNFERARELYGRAVGLNPKQARGWLQWGRLERAQGNISEARRLFVKGLKECPGNKHLSHALALLEKDHGDREVARSILLSALERDAENPYMWKALGDLERTMGRRDEAQLCFTRGVYRRGNAQMASAQCLVGLADLDAMQAKVEAGREKFRLASQFSPHDAKLLRAWALFEKQHGAAAEASELFRQSAKTDSTDSRTWLLWGLWETSQGDADTARAVFNRALEFCPRCSFLYLAWGLMEKREGMIENARRIFKEGVEACPSYGPLWLEWGMLETISPSADESCQRELVPGARGANRGLREPSARGASPITLETNSNLVSRMETVVLQSQSGEAEEREDYEDHSADAQLVGADGEERTEGEGTTWRTGLTSADGQPRLIPEGYGISDSSGEEDAPAAKSVPNRSASRSKNIGVEKAVAVVEEGLASFIAASDSDVIPSEASSVAQNVVPEVRSDKEIGTPAENGTGSGTALGEKEGRRREWSVAQNVVPEVRSGEEIGTPAENGISSGSENDSGCLTGSRTALGEREGRRQEARSELGARLREFHTAAHEDGEHLQNNDRGSIDEHRVKDLDESMTQRGLSMSRSDGKEVTVCGTDGSAMGAFEVTDDKRVPCGDYQFDEVLTSDRRGSPSSAGEEAARRSRSRSSMGSTDRRLSSPLRQGTGVNNKSGRAQRALTLAAARHVFSSGVRVAQPFRPLLLVWALLEEEAGDMQKAQELREKARLVGNSTVVPRAILRSFSHKRKETGIVGF